MLYGNCNPMDPNDFKSVIFYARNVLEEFWLINTALYVILITEIDILVYTAEQERTNVISCNHSHCERATL